MRYPRSCVRYGMVPWALGDSWVPIIVALCMLFPQACVTRFAHNTPIHNERKSSTSPRLDQALFTRPHFRSFFKSSIMSIRYLEPLTSKHLLSRVSFLWGFSQLSTLPFAFLEDQPPRDAKPSINRKPIDTNAVGHSKTGIMRGSRTTR